MPERAANSRNLKNRRSPHTTRVARAVPQQSGQLREGQTTGSETGGRPRRQTGGSDLQVTQSSARILVAGVGISHPQRVLFPAAEATKLDLARYYETIGDWIVPHVADRPLTLVRCPTGTGSDGVKGSADCFYMKHSKVWAPDVIRRVRIREKTKIGEYLIADSVEALIGLAQMDVLEVHTWNACFSDVERPDRIVIDLDPGDQVAWRTVVEAAKLVRDLLLVLDLESFVKTTGGRGLHVVVPLTPASGWAECLDFARAFAELLVRHQPSLFTDRFAKSERSNRILVDYLRNNRTNTSVAAYSTRARPDAPVSTPLSWPELSEGLDPRRFTLRTIPGRLARRKRDPWKAYWAAKQRISPHAIRAVERM